MQKQPSCSAGLLELTKKLEDEEPTIPDELIRYLLRTVGVNVQQKEGLRLVAAATEHFMGLSAEEAEASADTKKSETTWYVYVWTCSAGNRGYHGRVGGRRGASENTDVLRKQEKRVNDSMCVTSQTSFHIISQWMVQLPCACSSHHLL
jgi:hypothetical protein